MSLLLIANEYDMEEEEDLRNELVCRREGDLEERKSVFREERKKKQPLLIDLEPTLEKAESEEDEEIIGKGVWGKNCKNGNKMDLKRGDKRKREKRHSRTETTSKVEITSNWKKGRKSGKSEPGTDIYPCPFCSFQHWNKDISAKHLLSHQELELGDKMNLKKINLKEEKCPKVFGIENTKKSMKNEDKPNETVKLYPIFLSMKERQGKVIQPKKLANFGLPRKEQPVFGSLAKELPTFKQVIRDFTEIKKSAEKRFGIKPCSVLLRRCDDKAVPPKKIFNRPVIVMSSVARRLSEGVTPLPQIKSVGGTVEKGIRKSGRISALNKSKIIEKSSSKELQLGNEQFIKKFRSKSLLKRSAIITRYTRVRPLLQKTGKSLKSLKSNQLEKINEEFKLKEQIRNAVRDLLGLRQVHFQ